MIKKITYIFLAVGICLGFLNIHTVSAATLPIDTPVITSISPVSGVVNSTVTITGTGFSPLNNKIKFGSQGTENNPVYSLPSNGTSPSGGTSVTFTVPESNYLACWTAVRACGAPATTTAPGVYAVSVISNELETNTVNFTVVDTLPAPVISSLSVTSGPTDTSVTITGTGFTATGNKIKFGNLGSENNPAYSLSSNGTSITFTVPYGNYLACWTLSPPCGAPSILTANGVYQISVINNGGTSNTLSYTVVTTTGGSSSGGGGGGSGGAGNQGGGATPQPQPQNETPKSFIISGKFSSLVKGFKKETGYSITTASESSLEKSIASTPKEFTTKEVTEKIKALTKDQKTAICTSLSSKTYIRNSKLISSDIAKLQIVFNILFGQEFVVDGIFGRNMVSFTNTLREEYNVSGSNKWDKNLTKAIKSEVGC